MRLAPRELPLALTGDRHLERYAHDGRLVIVFRPVAPGESRTLSALPDDCFTAWVGRYEGIIEGREGEFLIRLLRSHRGADHTYPGLEIVRGNDAHPISSRHRTAVHCQRSIPSGRGPSTGSVLRVGPQHGIDLQSIVVVRPLPLLNQSVMK
ncbi:MAG: hypothetical protein LC725_06575 [Lentisphaerae bacterium]|nr:hypothetical protein [Lentisphaerota bacterium]